MSTLSPTRSPANADLRSRGASQRNNRVRSLHALFCAGVSCAALSATPACAVKTNHVAVTSVAIDIRDHSEDKKAAFTEALDGDNVPNGLRVAEEGVVAIATPSSRTQRTTLCSGAVVASNLVLTARHCVSDLVTELPSCDSRGRSHNGRHIASERDPSSLRVYVGKKIRLTEDMPVAHAVRIFVPEEPILCNADIAFFVLDRALDVRVLPLQLSPIRAQSRVAPIGYGGGEQNEVGHRVVHRPEPIAILPIGPNVLGEKEFGYDGAICRGDSGGPAIDIANGSIVGVASRGEGCVANANHVFTRVDGHTELATRAFNAARDSLVKEMLRAGR